VKSVSIFSQEEQKLNLEAGEDILLLQSPSKETQTHFSSKTSSQLSLEAGSSKPLQDVKDKTDKILLINNQSVGSIGEQSI
jgi:hypothetical protein